MKWREIISKSALALIVLVIATPLLEVRYGIKWFPEVVVAWGTLVLAYATYQLGRTTVEENSKLRKDSRDRETRDRKGLLLKELKDWVFELRNVSLKSVTEESLPFREATTALTYGIAFNRVDYFAEVSLKIFEDDDLSTKVNNVANCMVAIMVFGTATAYRSRVNESSFKAFRGPVHESIRNSLLGEYENILTELRKQNPNGIEQRLIELANQHIYDRYVLELNNSESTLLLKVTELESSLL